MKTEIKTTTARLPVESFDMYDEIGDHWLVKARRLQRRRWRKLEKERRWRRYKDNEFVKFQYINLPERRKL